MPMAVRAGRPFTVTSQIRNAGLLGPKALARCGARGETATIGKLVRVFRANGVSLAINQGACRRAWADRTQSDATNGGPTGLRESDATRRREGSVLCTVKGRSMGGGKIEINKFDGDQETHLAALNVTCAVYPYSAARERSQVLRLKRALQAVVRATLPKS